MVAAAALLALQAGAATARAQDWFAEAARLVEAARPKMGAPGVSVAVALDDRLVWAAGDGLADVENGVPATADTVYRIASISKTMTATAVMQLVERGRVSLDDPIQKYVPSFPDKGGLTITLREILTHTSGIRHYKAGEMESLTPYDSVADAIRIFKDDPLLFTPGTKYSYSTYAYNLLEGVVESASGLTFEAYLQEHVWNPAGMAHTYLEHPQTIVAHRARAVRARRRRRRAERPLRRPEHQVGRRRHHLDRRGSRPLPHRARRGHAPEARDARGDVHAGHARRRHADRLRAGLDDPDRRAGPSLDRPQRRRHRRHDLPAARPAAPARGGDHVQRPERGRHRRARHGRGRVRRAAR